jgi:hypothetical protein
MEVVYLGSRPDSAWKDFSTCDGLGQIVALHQGPRLTDRTNLKAAIITG